MGALIPDRRRARNERRREPMAMRDARAQALTASTATAQARHAGGETRLIDEDQALRIEVGLRGKPRLTGCGHVGAILLGCVR